MSTKGDNSFNPFEWAQAEYKTDPSYWKDRARNGSELIRDIAAFVMEHGEAGREVNP